MEEILQRNDRLIELLTHLKASLASDYGEESLQVVQTMKKEGDTLKKNIEDAKMRFGKKLELSQIEFKRSQDEYEQFGEKEEASRQLDKYKIDQKASCLAVETFSRDEKEAERNLEQARKEHTKAEDAFTNTFCLKRCYPYALVRIELDHAKERLAKAEARMQATTDAKEQQKKAEEDAAERYADAKNEYNESKAQMKKIHQTWDALKDAIAFTTRACAELEIILNLTESDCSSTPILKQALEKGFSQKFNGADEESTYMKIMSFIFVKRVTKIPFDATAERWQTLKEALLANLEPQSKDMPNWKVQTRF